MKKIIVVGGGPAGMMAAIKAAETGGEVLLLEKMPQPGRKLLITGKGRCNLTNVADTEEMVKKFSGGGKFLYSSLRAFDNTAVRDFFAGLGVATKVERGGRIFPTSDKAADILTALLNRMKELGIEVKTSAPVKKICLAGGKVSGAELSGGEFFPAAAVILAVGGASYPATGSAGEGYALAGELGHTVTDILPALVPLETEEEWVKEAQGLSLRNVAVSLMIAGKKVAAEFGEMMFTHFGVTGPLILTLSRTAAEALAQHKTVELVINLKPALSEEKLSARVLRDFTKYQRKQLKNALQDLLPQKIINPVLDAAFLEEEKFVHEVTAKERGRLVYSLQHLLLTVLKTRPLAEAIVTAGGISLKEINPKTMASKLIPGLYFAGEIMDVAAVTGGFNLQAAWSTGAAAGTWSARSLA